MSARYADRLWMIGGVAVVAILVVITWLLLVSPQRTEADDYQEQTRTAQAQAQALRTRTAKLKADQARIGELTRERDALAAALPSTAAVPAFLRQLQASGTTVGVTVSGITVGDPAEEESVPGVWALPIQLTAEGTAAQLGAFLDQLQSADQKRAVLIEAAGQSGGATGAAQTTLALTVKAFVAPPVGAGAPTLKTD
jgi:type IV pilus assembly protein PilO